MFGITGSSYGTPSSSRPQTSSRVAGAGVRGIQSLRNASSSSTGKAQNNSSTSTSSTNGTSETLRSNPFKSRPVNPDAYQPTGHRPGANSALPRDGSRVVRSSTPNYGRGRPASASQTALERFSHAIGPTAVRFGGKVYRLDPATGKLLSPRSAAAQKREATRKWTPDILAQVKEEERVKALEKRKKITQQQRNRGKILAPGEKAVHTAALARLGLQGTIVLLQNKLRHSSRLRHNLQVSAKHAPGGATVLGPREFAKAVENAGVRLHPDDVDSVFQYADDDNTGSVTFSHLLARITNDFADQGLAAQTRGGDVNRSGSKVGAPSTTLAVAPDDEARYARSRANHRAIMEEAATAVLPRMGFSAADEHLRAKYQSKGEHLRRVFLRICRGRGPLVNRKDMRQALHDFGIQFHTGDEDELLDHYLDPRTAVAASTAAAPAKSPPPAGRIDYHIFLDLLGRDVAAAQPLFGEMFEREAQARAEADFGKRGPEAAAKAQGFKHVQEILQKHLDRSDSLLLSFLAADVDEKAAISFDAFLHLCQDAGFNFAISDLEAVFGRSDNDQDHRLDLDEFLRMFCRDRYAYDVNLKTLPSSAFEQTLVHAREGRPLPRLGARRCREVVVNAFQNQADKKFMEVFRRQFLKTLSKRKITEMPDDPAEQDRLILEAALNFDEFTVFVQEITNLRLAMSDLKGLFDSFSETRADADNGGNSSDDNRVVPLKKFINHFNNYTEERFSFLKSYILNPYHRDMTFASRVPEIGVDRVRETLEKKYREMPDNLTLYKILRRRDVQQSGILSLEEFNLALQEFKMELSKADLVAVCSELGVLQTATPAQKQIHRQDTSAKESAQPAMIVDYMKLLDMLRPLRFDHGGKTLFERTWAQQDEERRRAAVEARPPAADHREYHLDPEMQEATTTESGNGDQKRYRLRPGQWHHAHRLGPDRLDHCLREVVFTKTTARLERQMRHIDTDGDGYLTYAEFRAALREIQLQLHSADVKWIFDTYSEPRPVSEQRRQLHRRRTRQRQRTALPQEDAETEVLFNWRSFLNEYDETGHFDKNRDAPILRQHYGTKVGTWIEKPKGKALVGADAHATATIKPVGVHQLLRTLQERFNSRRERQFDPVFKKKDEFLCGIISRASLAKALTEMGVQAADEDMADLFEKYRKKFPKRYRTYMDSEGFDYNTFMEDMRKFLGPLDAHRGDWQQASKIAQLGLEDQAYKQAIAKHAGFNNDQLDAQRLGLDRFEEALRGKIFRRGSFKLEQIMRRTTVGRQPYLTRDEFVNCLREFEFNGVEDDFEALFDKYAEEDVPNPPRASQERRTWGSNARPPTSSDAAVERRLYFPDLLRKLDPDRFATSSHALVEKRPNEPPSPRKKQLQSVAEATVRPNRNPVAGMYPGFGERRKGKRFFHPVYDYTQNNQGATYNTHSNSQNFGHANRAVNPNAALGDGGGAFLGGRQATPNGVDSGVNRTGTAQTTSSSKFASRFRAGVKMLQVPASGSGGMPTIGVERLERNIHDRMLASRKSRQHLERVCQNADRDTNSQIREEDFHKIFKELKFLVSTVDIRDLFLRYAKLPADEDGDGEVDDPTLDVVRFVRRFVPEAHIRETAADAQKSAFEKQRPNVRSNVWF